MRAEGGVGEVRTVSRRRALGRELQAMDAVGALKSGISVVVDTSKTRLLL